LAINISVSLFIFKKYVHKKKDASGLKTNVDEMIGKKCVVETEINDELGTGYVKLYGDSWRALSIDDAVIPKGTKVIIKELKGNKVIVSTIS
jgi:membrane protein implicated in regulation of membrane protease activity